MIYRLIIKEKITVLIINILILDKLTLMNELIYDQLIPFFNAFVRISAFSKYGG